MSKVQTAEIIIAAHNRSQRGIDEATRGLNGLASNVKALFATFSAGFVVSKVFGAISDGFQEMGEVSDHAANLGMMSDSLFLLTRAAKDGGAGVGEVVGMLRKVDENSAAALSGNKAMAESFQRLGVSADVLRGLAPERQLEVLAKAYASAGKDAEAFDALLNITGAKTAPKLLEVLNQLGSEGLDGLAAKYRVASEAGILAADQLQDAWRNVMEDMRTTALSNVNDIVDILAGLDPGWQDEFVLGRAAQGDINRRKKAQNDAAQREADATRSKKDAEHAAFMEQTKKAMEEEELLRKQEEASKKLWAMADDRIDKEWDLLAAQAEAPAARSMNTMSGADLNSFVQQQSFQANEDRRKAEHDRRIERLQNELLAVTKEMRDFAKANGIKEWD